MRVGIVMRETLMLAQMYNPEHFPITGAYVSEKLDGIRCWWDGGVSIGKHVDDIPWANHGRSDFDAISTGLWSRYFKVIHAPVWFIAGLPEGVCLDGELFSNSGIQNCNSVVRSRSFDKGWSGIRFFVFDTMTLGDVLQPGTVNNPNCKITLTDYSLSRSVVPFVDRYMKLYHMELGDYASVCNHIQLPNSFVDASSELDKFFLAVVSNCGEGVMLRRPMSLWVPKRSPDLVKLKDYDQDVGIVVGVEPGIGRLVGLMGSLLVSWRGQCFALGTGFSDEQRSLDWKIGMKIGFRYRTLSDSGVPKEARYLSIV